MDYDNNGIGGEGEIMTTELLGLRMRIAELLAERDMWQDRYENLQTIRASCCVEYEEALQDIADDPHCYAHEKSFTTDAEMSYAAGVVDGHRCAARKAREALNR
jgi:hypothetical protein